MCYGVDVGLLDGSDVEGQLLKLDQVLEIYPVASDKKNPILRRLCPVRLDGCGNYDCYLIGPGYGRGSVVFWDHEVHEGPAYLLGGSLGSYLKMWADNLVHRFANDGTVRPEYVPTELDEWPWGGKPEKTHPWPFNESWISSNDPIASELLSNPEFRTLMLEQDHSNE